MVTVAPEITYDDALKAGIVLKAGASLNIQVQVQGIPEPKVSWKHQDEVVIATTKDGYSALSVKPTSGKDSGIYTVLAENCVGTASAQFTVTVKGV